LEELFDIFVECKIHNKYRWETTTDYL